MAITKQLVDLMHGATAVHSEVNTGTEFVITLPFVFDPEASPASVHVPEALTGKRALLVEDHPLAAQIAVGIMESAGLTVVNTDNATAGRDALKSAGNCGEMFDFIIIDNSLPETDGVVCAGEFAAVIAEKSPAANHPHTILLVNAFARQKLDAAANTRGIDRIVQKPLIASGFLEILGDLIGAAPLATAAPAPAAAMCFAQKKVLLAEDNFINQEVAREMLAPFGMQLEIVDNGEKAVEAVRKNYFDLVLMDIQMPQMDGYQATKRIRSFAETRFHKLPIVAMTAHALKDEHDHCMQAGMNDHIAKPIEFKALEKILKKWLKDE